MNEIFDKLGAWLSGLGISSSGVLWVRELAAVFFILLVAVIAYFITKKLLIRGVHTLALRSKSTWDDILVEKKVFRRLAYVAPAIIINYLTPYYLGRYEVASNIVELATALYMVVVILRVFLSLANAFHEIITSYPFARDKPIKGYVQVIKILAYIIGIIVIISILLGEKNLGWLAGFGAFSAVLMLIFKDPILGFVGGIQLSANNMIQIGDWIEMPKYGADGTVIDVSLTTVKVQNWNKTITTIPTYTLVTDYFKNWRGMEESGGRRIKRSVNIDMNSIRFCTPEMLERFKKYRHVSEYVEKTEKAIQEYNKKYEMDNSILVNGRRQTNIGVFRAYLKGYLRNHPRINPDMTFLIRQLQPGEQGLPVEIYVFSKEQAWAVYEDIQADIFDHILAVIPQFDLQVFQNPTGADFRHALTKTSGHGQHTLS
ncbi:MAG: mechanosensitive ion channel [Bacteroidales bacterium]